MISSGELAPGQQVPTEPDLMARYGVSRMTARSALGVLRAEGLVEVRQGTGTYVRAPQVKVRRDSERYHGEKARARLPLEERSGKGAVEDATGLGSDAFEHDAEFDTEPATEDLAAAFGVEPGAELLCRTYSARSKQEGRPLWLIHSYLVYDVAAKNPDLLTAENEPWQGGTLNQLWTLGIELAAITEYVTARPPTAAECELLGIGPGTSVICIRKVSADTEGHVVEISDILLPADRTELVYTTKLEPWQ